MSNELSTAHGMPSWLQHTSADPTAARKFYEDVLGWAVSEMPMADGSAYAAIVVDEKPVGGFAQAAINGGWLAFVTVDDVDGRVAKAKVAGATIIGEPLTVPGVGRMATIADPFGAAIAFIDYSKA